MKVVMFSRFPSDINRPRGGVETATIGLARGLVSSEEDISLHIVTLEKNLQDISVEVQEGITIHRLPDNNVPMFIDILIGPGKKKLRKYLLSLQPDLVHFQETYGLGMGEIGIPSIFTVHGFDSLNLVTEKSRLWRLRSLIWKQVEKVGLRRQKQIISIIPYVRQEIEKYTTAEIHDIENSISESYYHTKRERVKGRIFFAGWLNPRKNLVGLLRALPAVIEKNNNISLHAAGEACDPEYYKQIESVISQYNLSEHVTLLGRIDQQAVKTELAQASIFVLPSKQENAPMAIAEAMAVGVPVISSNVCGMPYMIEDGKTGFLVDPEDTDGFSDSILNLLDNEDVYLKMSQAAQTEALDKYHPQSVASRTISVYKYIINTYS